MKIERRQDFDHMNPKWAEHIFYNKITPYNNIILQGIIYFNSMILTILIDLRNKNLKDKIQIVYKTKI